MILPVHILHLPKPFHSLACLLFSTEKMHPHHHLTLFLLFIIITVASVSAVDDERYVNCSAPFRCGNREDIGYPFWGQDRAAYCGQPGFELTNCGTQGNPPEIKIKNLSYQVLGINNSSRTITVLRTDYSQNLCPDLLHNTSIDSNFNYTTDTQNITLHYVCPTATQLPSLEFPCSFNGSTTPSANFYTTPAIVAQIPPNLGSTLGSCEFKVDVSANQTEIQTLTQNSNSQSLEIVLRKGFGLQWNESMGTQCIACEASLGECGSDETTSEFRCFCKDRAYASVCGGTEAAPTPAGSPQSPNSGTFTRRTIIIGITSTVGVLILVSIIATYIKRRELSSVVGMIKQRKNSKYNEKIHAFMSNHSLHKPQRYSYSEVKRMTNSFTTKLGQGGFGTVYKGKLLDGGLVAVKMLDKSKADGEGFINEVASIGRTNHVNVVTLLGFCYDGRCRALIYEYMPNGSLDKLIFHPGTHQNKRSTSHQLEWKVLFEIAVGIAKGLEYLHGGCNIRIVHFDIKPHNILLDEDFCPKISDFGLAKLRNRNESMVSLTGAKGTIGYIAPEIVFRNYGGVSSKSDVYSYGIMILEMVGGRRTSEPDADVGSCSNSSETWFPDQFYKYLELQDFSTIYGVLSNDEENLARKMILVGLWCIQTNPSSRPSMVKVVDMLEGSLESVQIPPKPYLYPPTTMAAASTGYTDSQTISIIQS